MAFNFGWDADNTAATAGTIIGVRKGYRWMMAQGWDIRDRYTNTTRDLMPEDETITSFADRLIKLAEQVKPANVLALPTLSGEMERMQKELQTEIESALLSEQDPRARARAAYLAIAVDLASGFQQAHPTEWTRALEDLNALPQMAQVLYHHSPIPAAEPIRERAGRVGFTAPDPQEKEWIWRTTYQQNLKDSNER